MTQKLMDELGRKPTFAESILALNMSRAGFSFDEIVRAIK